VTLAVIAGVGTALPPRRYTQEELCRHWRGFLDVHRVAGLDVEVERIFANAEVDARHLAMSPAHFAAPERITASYQDAVELGAELASEAAEVALERAGLRARDIACLTFTSTLYSVPAIDALLINRLGFPLDVKRQPLVGLGCVGGAAGLARVADYLAGHPREAALLVTCEVLSGMWQGSFQQDLLAFKADPSAKARAVGAIVGGAIFGDGAAAVVLVGRDHPLAAAGGPRLVETASHFVPGTLDMMKLELVGSAFRESLRPELPERSAPAVRKAVEAVLARGGATLSQVRRWIVHPGGPRILDACEAALEQPAGALGASRAVFRRIGNVSSATVLFVLQDELEQPAEPGSIGVVAAVGPGLCVETLLTHWG
jgi:alkylresorcinol/alkylpyrone synthase